MSKLSRCIRSMVAAAVVLAAVATTVRAQQSLPDDSRRKIKSRVSPVYPELARKLNVAGRVKIEIIVAPDGHVRSTRPIGGHPILVQACTEAVKEWKFVASPEESTQIVEFDFKGN
ncbi:MAG TPA: energy transducer TonB [Candidatus Eremiobacteraceae bacterium]|nr:energy transducer TonB [Candidatus Eremiobacteraceae bacterium]